MAEKWKVTGTYFETCNCVLACPCVFPNSPNIPTGGECTAIVGWHIEQGAFGGVALNGLNVAMAIHSPGDMQLGNWKVALYLDEKASASQKDALTQIFGGQAGGQMAVFAPAIGQVLGVSSKQIDYQANGRKRSMEIAGVSKAEIEAISGLEGAEVTLNNLVDTIAPGFPLVQAVSKQLSYHDYGMKWEISGKNGFYSPFTYQVD